MGSLGTTGFLLSGKVRVPLQSGRFLGTCRVMALLLVAFIGYIPSLRAFFNQPRGMRCAVIDAQQGGARFSGEGTFNRYPSTL